jgi:aminopeptidase YwaD
MITRVRLIQSLILALALTASAFAQQPGANQPSAARLRQMIEYLASDALEGRRTGTPGATSAAYYISGEFKRLGLRPGLQPARAARTRGEKQAPYLQSFPYVSGVALGKNNVLMLNGHPVDGIGTKLGKDWLPLGFSSNASIKAAGIVFAGYGISSAELKYNDYAASDVKNRIAIAFAGTPDGENPHGQFFQAGQLRFKAAAARAAGARALLIIASEEKLKDGLMAQLSYDNAGEAGIPVIVISRQLAARILTQGSLAEYQEAADSRKIEPPVAHRPISAIVQIPNAVMLRAAQNSPTLTLSTDVVRQDSPSFNVIGVLPGSDPKLKDEAIVIGAHYDHLGTGGEGSLAPNQRGIHHGADDNASGVAGLIELARMFSSQSPKPRRTIVFIAFSGEEEGLIGSNYYVNNPVVPVANTVAMINLDMIGRLNENRLVIGGIGTAEEWRYLVQNKNTARGLSSVPGPLAFTRDAHVNATGFSLILSEDGFGPSDHSSFYGKQIPVLFFWTGTHNDYHKPSDTAEKINYGGEARVIAFVANIVRDIDKSDKRPTYTVAKASSTGRASGFRIYLGTIPNYAESNDGLKIDGVRDDSPAAKAGLKAGDTIVRIAGRDVKNVYDYTQALGEMKAGQEYEMVVVRGSDRLTLKITPEARK